MFKYKVALVALVTSLVCVVISGGIMAGSVAVFFLDILREDVAYQTSKIAAILSSAGAFDKKAVEEAIKDIPIFIGSSVRVFASDFSLVHYTGEKAGIKESLQFTDAEKSVLAAGKTVSGVRLGAAPADRRYYFAAPIMRAGTFAGGVLSSASFQAGEERRRKLQGKIFAALAVALFISLAAGFWLSGWLLAPFSKIRPAVRSFSEGDFTPRIGISSSDEIGKLSRTLNEMAAKIEALLKSQRDFLADSSHEFKTPLTSIIGAGEAIADGVVSSPEEVKVYAARICSEARHLSELVSDILELSRLQSGAAAVETYPVDIARIFTRTLERYGEEARRKGLKIEMDMGGREKIEVAAEEKRLSRAVRNMVENAVFHSREGSLITVKAVGEDDSGLTIFEICNQGDPVSGEERGKVFGRFYRGGGGRSSACGGTGLGLAICRQIVEAFGGRIEFVEPRPPFDAVLRFGLKKAAA